MTIISPQRINLLLFVIGEAISSAWYESFQHYIYAFMILKSLFSPKCISEIAPFTFTATADDNIFYRNFILPFRFTTTLLARFVVRTFLTY
jgi:hypothetical protein